MLVFRSCLQSHTFRSSPTHTEPLGMCEGERGRATTFHPTITFRTRQIPAYANASLAPTCGVTRAACRRTSTCLGGGLPCAGLGCPSNLFRQGVSREFPLVRLRSAIHRFASKHDFVYTEPPTLVTMLLKNRGVFALGFRAFSTNVTRGPLMDTRPNSDMSEFRKLFSKAKHIAIITGAGVSAESGVPTFRGEHETWRKWKSQDLATPEAFSRTPSRVWEFYQYRREQAMSKKPNAAHLAIAECEARLRKQGRSVVVITQCIDDLHQKAGSKHVLRVHGSLTETRCISCGDVTVKKRNPICAALKGKGAPGPDVADAPIPVDKLPRCDENDCHGLLRPNVVFFGETLDSHILTKVEKEMEVCDLCLVVGTSSIVYPAAMFGPQIASRGVPVAEFNMSATPKTEYFTHHFQGPCGITLPPALERHESEVI